MTLLGAESSLRLSEYVLCSFYGQQTFSAFIFNQVIAGPKAFKSPPAGCMTGADTGQGQKGCNSLVTEGPQA